MAIPDQLTDGEHVEDGADHGHQEDGAQLVEEKPVGHEVAGLPDNGWQEEEEEDVGGEGDHAFPVVGQEEDQADEEAGHDEDARLREVVLHSGHLLEAWSRVEECAPLTKLDEGGGEDPDKDDIGHLHPRPLHVEHLEVFHLSTLSLSSLSSFLLGMCEPWEEGKQGEEKEEGTLP